MNNMSDMSPQERLAVSRRAIVRYMNQEEQEDPTSHRQGGINEDGLQGLGEDRPEGGTWSVVKHAVKVWWQHHPAQLALNLAKPALGRYAEEKPLQLLGIAAGVGAAAVLIRPWRLISVTGVLFAALKASDVPVLLMSMLSSSPDSAGRHKDSA